MRELLNRLEAEILDLPGVEKDPERSRVSIYRLGGDRSATSTTTESRTLPRAVRDRIVASGKAEPHRGGFPAVVSYRIENAEDLPGALELFRTSYERAASERRAGRETEPT